MSSIKEIIEALARDIALGDLPPGAHLSEAALAKRFGLSRTPIREALTHLVAQNILVDRGRRGTFVAEVTREELAQMLEAMHEIEVLCARLAAQRMSLLQLSDLRAAQFQCHRAAQNVDMRRFLLENSKFHEIIYTGTHNRYVEEVARSLRIRTAPFRASRYSNKAELFKTIEEHDAIVSFIEKRDSAAAMTGMELHMTSSHMKILERRKA